MNLSTLSKRQNNMQTIPERLTLGLSCHKKLTQAECLNHLRQHHIAFLNLGNIIYCHQIQLLLFFKHRQLCAYDTCKTNH